MTSDDPKITFKLRSPACPYPNIILSKSYENLSMYVDTVTNYVYLDHLGSMTSNDP